jgi:Asp-tRNA(Asn)/Glu-tRNA(Gln) amidotransferase A subunit family amidase
MTTTALETYDPRTFRARTFYDATPRFRDGTDTPRAYLERCLETIAACEPVVQAFAALNEAGARAAADASTARWQAGQPLSAIDGLPIGIKDLLETRDASRVVPSLSRPRSPRRYVLPDFAVGEPHE